MRGLPGSGKSTQARKVAGAKGIIHSTDDYSYVNGVYRYEPSQIKQNHEKNFEAFCKSLKNKVPIVVCDNTNIKRWEYLRYQQAALSAGYVVHIVIMPLINAEISARRNTHNVPISVIRHMIDNWEN